MTNARTTKRALLLSVVSLIVCFTMLLGTTYAWFTDSVTSAGNIIKSGTLDIEMYWADGKEDPASATWTNAASGAIFNNDKWEPGYAEVRHIKIENKGTLALKYALSIDANGEVSKLADVIDVYYADPAVQVADRAALAAKTPMSNLTKALAGMATTANGTLKAGESVTITIALKMQETAGNEYQNLSIGSDFAIKLLATQLDYEKDSFDEQYDKDAVYYDKLVTSAEELYDAVANASGDIVIAVDGDIALTKAMSKGGLKSIKFVAWDDEATIDQATYNMHFAGANVTFDGLNLTHGEKAYGNGGQTSTAFAVWDAKEVSYIDCTFDRSVGTIHAATHNFIRCTFNGVYNPDNSKSEYPLYICDGQDYNVIDCTFNCTNRGAILFYNDGGSGVDTLNISNTKFLGDIIADKTAVEIHNNSQTQTYNVNIKDVEVGSGIVNGLYRIKSATVGEVNVNVDGVTKVATAKTAGALSNAIQNANDGDTVYLDSDVDMGSTQFAFDRPVTIDLNGNELALSNNWGGMTMTNGASIKNGTINQVGNTAAIKIAGEVGTIENVTINVTPTVGKTKTGIQVYNGKYVEAIRNVTITGTTQGIEVAKGSRVDLIENVTVKAVADGEKKGVALLVNAASVGKAVNCTFEGDYGVYMMLNGEFHVALELDNCTVVGTSAAVIAHDEVGISNITNCSLAFTYDAATTLNGEFIWNFEDECLGVVTLNKPN